MQLYQPARNKDNGQFLPSHILKTYKVPDSVNAILAVSCYDCHSNNTLYPWYSYIQPARIFMERHIKNGKSELNFSEFGNYTKRRQGSKFKSIIKQVQAGDMPLSSYTMLHRNAKLTTEEKTLLISWVERELKKMEE